MPRRYFETRFAISDRKEAEFLQNRSNWDIVNAIIDAGIEGITSKELSELLKINYKTVTETTKHLSQMGWIRSETPKKKLGRPSKGQLTRNFRKPAYLHVWRNLNSFEPTIEEQFMNNCRNLFEEHSKALNEYVKTIDQIFQRMKNSKFYPKEKIHEECGLSHEGYEFSKAILHAFLILLENNDDFQAIMKKHKLATDKAFQE